MAIPSHDFILEQKNKGLDFGLRSKNKESCESAGLFGSYY
jgi:hypothetical protein